MTAPGLGWPGRAVGNAAAGLGWPGAPVTAPSVPRGTVHDVDTVVGDAQRDDPVTDGPVPGDGSVPGDDAVPDDELRDDPGSGTTGSAAVPRGTAQPGPRIASDDPAPDDHPAPADGRPAEDVAVPDDDVPADEDVPPGGGGSSDDETPIAQAARMAVALRSPDGFEALARPARTRVLVVANQKGGVGKTTSTVNLAAALALAGQHVVVLDLDPQGNASTALGVAHAAGTPSIYDVVIDGKPLGEVLQDSPDIPGLRVAPATIDLAGAEIELVPMVAREARLRRALHTYLAGWSAEGPADRRDRGAVAAGPPVGDRPDYVLVDCPPSLGLLTLNALVAADEVLIPIQCEYYALEGLGQLVQTVEMVTTHLNEELQISAILLTMYDSRTRLAAQVADEVRSHFTDRVLPTAIPRSVRVSEAPSYGQTVLTYDPGSSGALCYVQAARELSASLPG